MKLKLSIATTVMLALMSHQLAGQTVMSPQSDSAQVVQLVHDWLAALKSKNIKEFERIMADDFITTNADGSVNTRDQEMLPFLEAELRFDTAIVEELSVSLHGTTAIVRGIGYYTGSGKLGKFASRERFTDVFLKRNGQWQVVSSHSSALRKK